MNILKVSILLALVPTPTSFSPLSLNVQPICCALDLYFCIILFLYCTAMSLPFFKYIAFLVFLGGALGHLFFIFSLCLVCFLSCSSICFGDGYLDSSLQVFPVVTCCGSAFFELCSLLLIWSSMFDNFNPKSWLELEAMRGKYLKSRTQIYKFALTFLHNYVNDNSWIPEQICLKSCYSIFISDGALQGMCLKGKCYGNNVRCDSLSNMCICKSTHILYAGKCVKK